MQTAFFSRLDDQIDLNHPLAILFKRVDWNKLHLAIQPLIARKPSLQKIVADDGLFGTNQFVIQHNPRNAGRKRVPLQIMLALTYLKHAFNLSDDALVEQWQRDVYFQYLSGVEFFQTKPPCDSCQISRFRKALGEEGLEILLSATIETAVLMNAIAREDLEQVIVDTTVMEKAIAHPTDSRLLEVARHHVAKAAKRHGLALKQTFAKEGNRLRFKAGRYAHAKQFRRMHKTINRQKTILGVLLREIKRKASPEILEQMQECMDKARRIKEQKKTDNNKLYAFHAPEVECIGKGKVAKPYEFGVKTSVVNCTKHSLVIGVRSFRGNPYDGHILAESLEQTSNLLQDIHHQGKPITIKEVTTDLGFRGADQDVAPMTLIHRGKAKRLAGLMGDSVWQKLKRRQAIEPVIGHLKAEHRMKRNWLKGAEGDAFNALLCGIGYNIRWLMRAIMRLGIIFLLKMLSTLIVRLILIGMRPQKLVGNFI